MSLRAPSKSDSQPTVEPPQEPQVAPSVEAEGARRRRTNGGSSTPTLGARAEEEKDGYQQQPGNKGNKRPRSPSSSLSGKESSLTPLTSPAEVRPKPIFPAPSNIAPRLARQFMRVQAKAHTPDPAPSKPKNVSLTESIDSYFAPLDSTDEESEDDRGIGKLVWVCLDMESRLADEGKGSNEDLVWWPAKIDLPQPAMRVVLFGNPPGHMGASGERRLNVPSPSVSNVRPMALDGRIRFNTNNYRTVRSDPSQASPRKKRKLDMEESWREARDRMVQEYERQENGGDPHSYYAESSSSGSKGKESTELEEVEQALFDFGSIPERRWRAPSADPLLELPGELVLAKEGKKRTQYWPAKLLEYMKPKKPNQRPKYKVLFFDGSIKTIEADWFYTTTDDEFSTVFIGDTTGNYGLDPDKDELEELEGMENFSAPFRPDDERSLRASSPVPLLPAPRPEEFQYELEIHEEFEYVKPILAGIMDRKYGPALRRSDDFMRGSGARQRVLDQVPLRGSLGARDKEELAYHIRSWARRREWRQAFGLPVDYPQSLLYLPNKPTTGRGSGRGKKRIPRAQDSDTSVLSQTSELSAGDGEAMSDVDAPPPSTILTEIESDEEQHPSPKLDTSHQRMASQNTANGNLTAAEGEPSEAAIQPEKLTAETGTNGQATEGIPERAPPKMTFSDLDPVEKITYCNNILLQEAILQILLWRTGQRTVMGLLSPEEEQRLHAVAMEESLKSNWVHDVIRLRQAKEKTMLPSGKSTAKGKARAKGGDAGTRGRTRRRV
ncbi:uncharacterized protein BXZ73DRAFT_101601 [Epithele typhae]|uniref:uncharacterized protein n=1 Tax=Epithele typhae TaxID=378194 RepID=UPI002008DD8E|nr:uncharacterized protein BXZ73DRAFT_101601 [Epithele typhae]KAH9931691.1 hypothetical protein BXZ73DRAFT_101601 [Epithele typhae]